MNSSRDVTARIIKYKTTKPNDNLAKVPTYDSIGATFALNTLFYLHTTGDASASHQQLLVIQASIVVSKPFTQITATVKITEDATNPKPNQSTNPTTDIIIHIIPTNLTNNKAKPR